MTRRVMSSAIPLVILYRDEYCPVRSVVHLLAPDAWEDMVPPEQLMIPGNDFRNLSFACITQEKYKN
jgi:hypothetical protein